MTKVFLFVCFVFLFCCCFFFSDGANADEIQEAEEESSGSNPESPQKKQRKESSGSSDLASPVTSAQHFGVHAYVRSHLMANG